jgi:hypothetical protein
MVIVEPEIGKLYLDANGRLLLVTEVGASVRGQLLEKRWQEPVNYETTVGIFRNVWTKEAQVA